MSKKKCDKCPKMAVWEYAPSDGDRAYCEDCVPRGCSCNVIDWESEDESDANQRRDDEGRIYPCCEYDYDETGWSVE